MTTNEIHIISTFVFTPNLYLENKTYISTRDPLRSIGRRGVGGFDPEP